jgi:hypothetical protein
MDEWREKAVFRQLALPVSVFDCIKDHQRAHEARHGSRLTISETVSAIVREHRQQAGQQQTVEREAQEPHGQEQRRRGALLGGR